MDSKGEIVVKELRKYDIVNLQGENGRHLLLLHTSQGIEAYAFTFGMENGVIPSFGFLTQVPHF